MKRTRIIINGCMSVLLLLMAAVLLTGCSSDNDTIANATDGSPLELKAAVVSGLATRSTTASDNAWTVGDIVTVKDGTTSISYQYAISDASTGAMTGTGTTIYFSPSETSKPITAWSYGGGTYSSTLPTSWSASTTQNTAATLQANDFLYASATAKPLVTTTLAFNHKMAKIVIQLKSTNTNITSSNTTLSNVLVKAVNVGTFDGSSWTTSGTEIASFTPLAGTSSGYLSTYTTLVIPQTMSGKELFRFTITSGTFTRTFAYTPATAVLAAGGNYIYTIDFNFDKVTLTAMTAPTWSQSADGTITEVCTILKQVSGTWTPSSDGAITVN